LQTQRLQLETNLAVAVVLDPTSTLARLLTQWRVRATFPAADYTPMERRKLRLGYGLLTTLLARLGTLSTPDALDAVLFAWETALAYDAERVRLGATAATELEQRVDDLVGRLHDTDGHRRLQTEMAALLKRAPWIVTADGLLNVVFGSQAWTTRLTATQRRAFVDTAIDARFRPLLIRV
jgi:hypothetical protein